MPAYQIGKIQTLVELNGDLNTFEANVSATSQGPFSIAITNQTQLDSGARPDFREVVDGFVSIVVRSDEDKREDHFVALKANEETNVNVAIEIVPIESFTAGSSSTFFEKHRFAIYGIGIASALALAAYYFRESLDPTQAVIKVAETNGETNSAPTETIEPPVAQPVENKTEEFSFTSYKFQNAEPTESLDDILASETPVVEAPIHNEVVPLAESNEIDSDTSIVRKTLSFFDI